MKRMMKVSAGFLLGALLCLGMLTTPQPAEAYYWICPNNVVYWCADVTFVNGVRVCNTGFRCDTLRCTGSPC